MNFNIWYTMLKFMTIAYLPLYRDKDATIYNFNIVYQMLKFTIIAYLPLYRDKDATINNFNIAYQMLKFTIIAYLLLYRDKDATKYKVQSEFTLDFFYFIKGLPATLTADFSS